LNKAHQIQLKPTKAQVSLLHQSFGCKRHSYNWALSKWQELYKLGEKPSAMSLIKLQNSIKKVEMPFYLDVNKCAVQYAIWDVEVAYKKMWKEKTGYPKFKKKGVKDSYVAVENNVGFKQKDKKIWLPRIGWVKCTEDLRFEGKVNNVVIKRIADKYFAVVNLISNEAPMVCDSQAIVGVDLGIKSLAICSNGKVFENPKTLKNNLKSLKRLQRGLSRKQKGSNNRKKQQILVARKHYKISCIRKNALHEVSSYLVNNFGKIVIEDLNVKGMLKNHKLAQAISDVGFGELSRQLAYKSLWKGVELVKANRYFASSKTCSNCGHKKETLKLSERIYTCEVCNHKQDRDLNAAINLANYSPTQKPCESKACGERVAGMQSTSKKHEILSNGYESNIKY
jgi:putative transposase